MSEHAKGIGVDERRTGVAKKIVCRSSAFSGVWGRMKRLWACYIVVPENVNVFEGQSPGRESLDEAREGIQRITRREAPEEPLPRRDFGRLVDKTKNREIIIILRGRGRRKEGVGREDDGESFFWPYGIPWDWKIPGFVFAIFVAFGGC